MTLRRTAALTGASLHCSLGLFVGSPALARNAAPERIRIGFGNIEFRVPDSDRNKMYSAFGGGARSEHE